MRRKGPELASTAQALSPWCCVSGESQGITSIRSRPTAAQGGRHARCVVRGSHLGTGLSNGT